MSGAESTVAPDISNATIHNDNNSMLIRLPAELRNRIFSYCMPEPAVSRKPCDRTVLRPPPLMQVCRQIRHETIAIHYTTCTFIARLDEDIVRWAKAIGPQAPPLLRSIKLASAPSYSPLASQRSQLLERMARIYAQFEGDEGSALRPRTLQASVYFRTSRDSISETKMETLNETEIAAIVAPHQPGCDGLWCCIHKCL